MNGQILWKNIKRNKFILLTLCAALVVRLGGTTYGLPYGIGNGDEAPFLLNPIAFLALKTLQPVFLDYPTFYSYILLVCYTLTYLVGHALGLFDSLTEMIVKYSLFPGNFFLIARVVTVLFGTATVGVTYLIGNKNFGRGVGLAAAILLAFSFTHASESHWALPDIPMTFFVTSALYFIYLLNGQGRFRYYVYAGILSGLAISTKYNAGLVLVPLFVSHILGRRAEGLGFFAILFDKRLVIAYVLVAYSFLLTSPYWIINFRAYFAAFQLDSTHMSVGQLGNFDSHPWLWVLTDLVQEELLVGVAFLFGIVYTLLRPSRVNWVLLSFVAITVLYIGSWSKPGLHYMLAIWPALALLVANAIFQVVNGFAGNVRRVPLLLAGLLLCIVIPSAIRTLWLDYQMSNEDTRTTAKVWIEARIPAASSIALNWYDYNPPLFSSGSSYQIAEIMTWPDAEYQKELTTYLSRVKTYRLLDLAEIQKTPEAETTSDAQPSTSQVAQWKTIAQLKAEGTQYIILSSYVYDRYWNTEPPPTDNPLRPAFDANKNYFATLLSSPELEPIQEFAPDSSRLGPIIKIYQIKSR